MNTENIAHYFYGSAPAEDELMNAVFSGENNPNNKAYQADADNRANQMNPNHRSHQKTHNANRRNKAYWMPEWAPDYPEYDD